MKHYEVFPEMVQQNMNCAKNFSKISVEIPQLEACRRRWFGAIISFLENSRFGTIKGPTHGQTNPKGVTFKTYPGLKVCTHHVKASLQSLVKFYFAWYW